ncbi:hypothetical protein HX777_24770, partial [Pseudomonas agarici]|nr:hypothetical protein [Pseudomonas agarici]
MSPLKGLLLCGVMVWLSGCAHGTGRLPYDAWYLGLFAPNYMEVWIETADAVGIRDRAYRR